METKVFLIVERVIGGFASYSKAIGFSFSRLDAEFEAWSRTKKERKLRCRMQFYSFGSHYSVEEVTFTSINKESNKGKDYSEFLKEKREEIQKKIDEKKKCSETDLLGVTDLERELDNYRIVVKS